jgi:hypothetical protein
MAIRVDLDGHYFVSQSYLYSCIVLKDSFWPKYEILANPAM